MASPSSLSERTPPWRIAGLFSTHFLTQRLAQPGSAFWPNDGAADAAFDQARTLLAHNEVGLRKGNEEDCEDRFISPLLTLLGFGFSNRRRMPSAEGRFLPDYLLYASPAVAEGAFHTGTREGYYADCLALLEAKRWGHNLSQEASGRGKAARGRSPHHQIRDYLSEADRLVWGILTNGARWRLYCKRDRASSFFEFDLAAVLRSGGGADEARARAEFRFFYALFRRDAFVRTPDGGCLLDAVRDGAQQFKEEVERRLRVQVFDCVEILGQGLLDNPANGLTTDDLSAIYEHALILLYRILFILNAEARELLPIRPTGERSRAYCNSYGLELVRQKLALPDTAAEYTDDATFQLYERLRALFTLINGQPAPPGKRDKNEELGIPRYNGGLFDPARFPFLETKRVADAHLSRVLSLLSFRTDKDGSLTAFDYASLGERHLGSIYEGLLEHRLAGGPLPGPHPPDPLSRGTGEGERVVLRLTNDRGVRKALGAYYTPQPWVEYIVEHTLRPLLAEVEGVVAERRVVQGVVDGEGGPLDDAFGEEVLRRNVCDPAMGSGHFLVEAVSYLAEAIAAHPRTAPRPELKADGSPRLKTDGSGEPLYTQEAKLAYWRRRVAEACIYGVDVNPLAVELAKLSLWLKTVDRVPLNFLDHHLRCGNSLLGTRLERLAELAGLKQKTVSRPGPYRQLPMVFSGDLTEALREAIADIHAIERVATDTHGVAKEKERLWREVSETLMPRFRTIGDLWMAPWFGVPLDADTFAAAIDDPPRAAELRRRHAAALDPLRCFHWELEFPDIFFDDDGQRLPQPGFDAVIGNPPWERIKLQENEFFAARSRAIAQAPRAADRKRLIAALPGEDPALWAEYEAARARKERELAFVQRSGLFPLMGRGDTNTYAVFAERALELIHPRGQVGLLAPSGIATDHTTQHFFQKLVEERRLVELLDFENRDGIFEDVHRSFKFSIIRMSGQAVPQQSARCGFFLHRMSDLADPERTFELTPDDFRLFNPHTLTCPIFRRRRDYELTRKIYGNVPVLVDKAKGESGNPWGISFLRMFDMTNDSHLFRTAAELEADGFWLGAGNVYTRGQERYLPLYEGKMVQMYDHRAASVVVNPANIHRPAQEQPTNLEQYVDPGYSPTPQFWVIQDEVIARLGELSHRWFLGYKDVTAPTNVRTMIPGIIPYSGVGNTFCLIILKSSARIACLLANLSSLVLDFATRQKVGGQHLNFFIVEQLPVLPPSRYDADFHGVRLAEFITARVLELCYTAHDLKGFAEELGYGGPPFAWDEERRLHLCCQLDALFFHLYQLSLDEAAEVLDTFPIVRRQDEAKYGHFRTRDLILAYHRAYAAGNIDAWVKG